MTHAAWFLGNKSYTQTMARDMASCYWDRRRLKLQNSYWVKQKQSHEGSHRWWILIWLQSAYIQSAGAMVNVATWRTFFCPRMQWKFVADGLMTLIIVTLSDGSNQQKYLSNQLTYPQMPPVPIPQPSEQVLVPTWKASTLKSLNHNHWPWQMGVDKAPR